MWWMKNDVLLIQWWNDGYEAISDSIINIILMNRKNWRMMDNIVIMKME